MSAPRRPIVLALAVAAAVAVGAASRASSQVSGDIAVVVHPEVPIDNLSFAELRRIVLGDREFWPSSIRIALLVRAPVAHERDVAVRTVCQMTEAQFRQHWIAKVFRAETPTGPRIVYSGEMAADLAMRMPGAVTFLDASIVPRGLKVVKIDGKLPGEPGYALR